VTKDKDGRPEGAAGDALLAFVYEEAVHCWEVLWWAGPWNVKLLLKFCLSCLIFVFT